MIPFASYLPPLFSLPPARWHQNGHIHACITVCYPLPPQVAVPLSLFTCARKLQQIPENWLFARRLNWKILAGTCDPLWRWIEASLELLIFLAAGRINFRTEGLEPNMESSTVPHNWHMWQNPPPSQHSGPLFFQHLSVEF